MRNTILPFVAAILLLLPAGHAASSGGGGYNPAPYVPPYVPKFDESHLSCSGLQTLEERVQCRYDLPENYKELSFLPEECRALNGKGRDDCLELYQNVRTCWEKHGEERQSCLREKVGVGDLNAEKAKCSDIDCLYTLRKKVYTMVKLRMYGLEEKAEEAGRQGADKNLIVGIVVQLENEKININNAATIHDIDGMQKILANAKAEWEAFKEKAIMQVRKKQEAEK